MTDSVYAIVHALEQSAAGFLIRRSVWLYPLLQSVHLIGIVLMAGTVFILDLRILGVMGSLRPDRLLKQYLPLMIAGFLLIFLSGSLLFIAHATDWYNHPVFHAKLIMIVFGLLNGVYINAALRRFARNSESPVRSSARMRVAGFISIVVWITVILCGRFMAYY